MEDETFLLTYGDGLSDVNLDELLSAHNISNAEVTLTAIRPKGRFGLLEIDEKNMINSFNEKSDNDSNWINGGYMVANYKLFNYINDLNDTLETNVLLIIAKNNTLFSHKHYGFWQAMDTLRDRELLENLILQKKTPWIK